MHIKHFQNFFSKSLESIGYEEVRQFLHHAITVRKLSPEYINASYSAIKFFYETTLEREWNMKHIPRLKKRKFMPAVLSLSEVKSIFNAVNNLKHKAILMTIYSAGLRVSEAANLKITDIDSSNMQILIRQSKGFKDRYSLLSQSNLNILRKYWKQHRPKIWLFPGVPDSKPISIRTIQQIFQVAKVKANVSKPVSVHSLRHSFATHLLESGTNILHIQQLLGHENIQTTIKYLHLLRLDVLNITSPLDFLEGPSHD